MKRFTSACTFIFVLLLSASLFASGVGLTGIGARATALGGNYRAIANDWSAMYWNPAGITQIKGMHFGISLEGLMPAAKYEFSQGMPPFSIYKSGELENEPKTFLMPAAGFVYGAEKLSVGITVFVPFGLGAEWDVMNTDAYNSAYPNIEFEDDLKVIAIQPTVAYQLTEKLSVGLGASITWADIIIRQPLTTPNPLLFGTDAATLGLQAYLKSIGLYPAISTSNYNHILTQKELTGDGVNFGLSFGAKYNITEDLSLGISGIWYNDVALDGKVSAVTYGAKTDPTVLTQFSAVLDGMVQAGQLDEPTKQQLLGIYAGQPIVKNNQSEADADLPLPMTLGAGLAYTGINKVLISADVSWTQWAAWDVIEIDIEGGQKSELVENWENGIRAGLGLEYQLNDPLTLRLGLYTEPTAIPDETLSITIPDPTRRNAINIGATYNLGLINIHASYETILFGDKEVKSWNYNPAAQGYDNMAGTYKMSVNNFMLGLGFNF